MVTVGIVWRNDPIDKPDLRGKCAFGDHYTLQKMLAVETFIIPWEIDNNVVQQNYENIFCYYVKCNLPVLPPLPTELTQWSVDGLSESVFSAV